MGLRNFDSFNSPLMYNAATQFTDLAHLRRYSDSITPQLRGMAGSATPETSPSVGATKPEEGEQGGCCGGSTNEQPQKARQARRRTKTGCLTCRKRRIKCGEERPICKNCIKSKRHCEGYNQRVIFKTPTTDLRYGPQYQTTMAYHTGSMPAAHSGFSQPMMPTISQNAAFAPLQPRLGDTTGLGIATTGSTTDVFFNSYNPQSSVYPTTTTSPSGMLDITAGGPTRPVHPRRAASWQGHSAYISPPQQEYSHHPSQSQQWSSPDRRLSSHTPPQVAEARIPSLPSTGMWPPTPVTSSTAQFPNSASYSMYTQTPGQGATAFGHSQFAGPPPHGKGVTSFPDDVGIQRPDSFEALFDGTGAWSDGYSMTEMLQMAATELEDDDYYDLEPEDNEIPTATALSNITASAVPGAPPPFATSSFEGGLASDHDVPMLNPEDLGALYTVHRASLNDLSVRGYNTFLYAGILDDYRPERVANPLRNPRTARVFAHFIHATGPSLSVAQRFGRAASFAVTEQALPRQQQGLWTYTLPVMALHNQGLLHAMLALSSLHIAKLQGADSTPSMKHYAYSLKRVHRAVGSRMAAERHAVPTIAATLLLGFYEIWAAEHIKWSSHLAGAKQLFVELDFPGMTMELRRRKRERQAFEQMTALAGQGLWSPMFPPQDEVPDIDDTIVAEFAGMHPRYDDHGRFEEIGQQEWRSGRYMPLPVEIGSYEIWQDLYWWYCKQDIIHSIISGEPLLMDFSRWTDCPPRAPINRFDAIHGSFDHVLMLQGRVADFASRDRPRKLRAMAVNNGVWRPGLFGNPLSVPKQSHKRPPEPPPSASTTSGSAPPPTPGSAKHPPPTPSSAGSGPGFFGMAPTSGPPRMPTRYEPQPTSAGLPPAPSSTSMTGTSGSTHALDLTQQTAAAEKEWQEIKDVLDSFPSYLGPAFNALTSEFTPPAQSPFGPAFSYSSYSINCLMAAYHMAHIIHYRSHPSMPPASILAAGVAAPHTATHANTIGRLAAGIQASASGTQPLNPNIGAALIEACVPLFFAGIQLRDQPQRAWLVSYVRDVEVRTGWASAALIANGCEKAWMKMYEAGRGPYYESPVGAVAAKDQRLNFRYLHTQEGPPTDAEDRRFIAVSGAARLHWAIGVLGMEEDVERMGLGGG